MEALVEELSGVKDELEAQLAMALERLDSERWGAGAR